MVNKKNVEEVASIVQRKEKILLTLITLDCVQMALLLFFANCITKTKLLQMICKTFTKSTRLPSSTSTFPMYGRSSKFLQKHIFSDNKNFFILLILILRPANSFPSWSFLSFSFLHHNFLSIIVVEGFFLNNFLVETFHFIFLSSFYFCWRNSW